MKLPNFGRTRARLASSADVEAEIAEHRRLLSEATAALAALDAARRNVLLGDDVAPIRDHEAKAAELRINLARLEARLDALGDQAAELAAAEAKMALDGRRAAVEARVVEMEQWLRQDYPQLSAELVNALSELHAIEREAASVNSDLFEAGREVDQVKGPHERMAMVLGNAEGMDAGALLMPGTSVSLLSALRLPEVISATMRAPGWRAPAWS